ncbi:hypothetical protein CR513_40326, partial [Mucuna pruriens]
MVVDSDEILCHVVPMEATHILLGRNSQFDRKVTHYRVTNSFFFVHTRKKVILKPLSPREVSEHQLKLKIKKEKELKEQKEAEKA